MKAYCYKKYGPPEVLNLVEVSKPVPEPNEILVRIRAATVTSGDVRLRSSDFPLIYWLPARLIFGLFRPKKKILGHEFSGIVEAIGKEVDRFEVGEEVFGTTTMLKGGSYAPYLCVPQQWKHGVVTTKPSNLGHEQSCALPIGSMTALFLLEKAHITKGKNILVYGASGSVGTYAVQLAKCFNAQVTGVCSTTNMEMVKSLGADQVEDYLQTDIELLSEKYDIVFDAVGKFTKSKARKILKPEGKFVTVKMLTKESERLLDRIKIWVEQGKISPMIDKTYTFDKMVQAHRYVDKGHKKGNVVILMD